MYKKLPLDKILNAEQKVVYQILDNRFIPFAPDNTDYANFKKQILAGEAELQDADGNVMTADAAQEFVRGLP